MNGKRHCIRDSASVHHSSFIVSAPARWSKGGGRQPFKLEGRVRLPYGSLKETAKWWNW